MFNGLVLGRYFPTTSLLHKLNPISKMICTFLFLFSLLIINNIYLYIVLIIGTLILIFISNVPLRFYLNTVLSLKWLLLIIFFFDFLITHQLELAITSILRVMLIVTYTSLLTFTTKIKDLTYGLERIFKPLNYLKIPVSELALAISLATSFIPTIIEQADKILKAQASRGIDFKYSNLRGKILALATMLIPLFILSFKKADDVANVMEVRLYGYDKKRSYYLLPNWTKQDNSIVILHTALLIIFILSKVNV